jgi:hypothetical protein
MMTVLILIVSMVVGDLVGIMQVSTSIICQVSRCV